MYIQATCALGEILQLDELEDLCNEHFYLFFASLVMRFGTTNGLADNTAAE